MEATVDKLETMFQKADADLDYLSRKLDTEFANDQETQGAVAIEKSSPAKMLQKIGEIKKEYAEIVKEAGAIKDAQKEAMDFFRTELMMVCETLGRLQQNVGMEAPEPEEMARVTAILGIEMPPGAAVPIVEASAEVKKQEPASVSQHNGAPVETAAPASTPEAQAPPPTTESPLERRTDGSEFIEIDDAEFQSTSSLIRGRVKLTEVNHTYRLLWTHYKEEGNTKTLNSQEMHKMGLRVTGQTGEAKLKVLRALKLLTISTKGDVKLI